MKSVIEWHRGKPKKSGIYLVYTSGLYPFATLNYSHQLKAFNAYDGDDNKDYQIKVKQWAEMPTMEGK